MEVYGEEFNPDDIVTVNSSVRGPRWLGLSDFIEKLAWQSSLDCKTQNQKGLLRETVLFEVKGSAKDIKIFLDELYATVANNNKK